MKTRSYIGNSKKYSFAKVMYFSTAVAIVFSILWWVFFLVCFHKRTYRHIVRVIEQKNRLLSMNQNKVLAKCYFLLEAKNMARLLSK